MGGNLRKREPPLKIRVQKCGGGLQRRMKKPALLDLFFQTLQGKQQCGQQCAGFLPRIPVQIMPRQKLQIIRHRAVPRAIKGAQSEIKLKISAFQPDKNRIAFRRVKLAVHQVLRRNQQCSFRAIQIFPVGKPCMAMSGGHEHQFGAPMRMPREGSGMFPDPLAFPRKT